MNWVKNRFWSRVLWYQYANRPRPRHERNLDRVEPRFRVTRWGIQRLRSGRNDFWTRHLSKRGKAERMRSVAYVSNADMKPVQRQLMGIRFKQQVVYRDNRINMLPIRNVLPAHLG